MAPLPDQSLQAGKDTKTIEFKLNEATGSMALGATRSLRTPAQNVAAIGARMQTAIQGLQAVPLTSSIAVVSSTVCDILIVHSLWCWFLTARKHPLQQLHQQEQPELQEQHAQQTLPVMQQWWCQLDGNTKKWGLVCALAATAIIVTCKTKSGQRRAARAAATRRKTIRQRSEEASARLPVPSLHLPQQPDPSKAIEADRSALSLDDEQWWFEGSASGKEGPCVQSQADDEASSGVSQLSLAGSRIRPASGTCGDAIQPKQQQQQQLQQQKLQLPLEERTQKASSTQSSPRGPRVRNLLAPHQAALFVQSTPRAGSSLNGTPRVDSSFQGTPSLKASPRGTPSGPFIRNLLSSDDLANSTPNGTSSSGSLPHKRPSLTNLLPTA